MTNGSDGTAWSPVQFATALQEAGQEMTAKQMQAVTELMSATPADDTPGIDPAGLASLGTRMAMFKTRVQSGGRISIPDTEREALGIDDGAIVQTFVIPLTQPSTNEQH